MRQEQENQVTMIEVVIDFLDQNQAIWTPLNAYATHFAELKTKYDALTPYRNKQSLRTQGVTQDKKKLKIIAISQAVVIAGNIEVFAADNNDNALRENIHVTKSGLDAYPDTELTVRLQFIYDNANTLLPQMSNYGNTASSLSQFQTAITEYSNAVPKPRSTVAQRKAATNNIAVILKEANIVLKKLDKLTLNFATTNADFSATYRNCRQVIEYGHHKTKLEITCLNADASPVSNVNISLISAQNTITANTNAITANTNTVGIALITTIKKGTYTLTAEKQGYDIYTQSEVKVLSGKITHIKFILTALD